MCQFRIVETSARWPEVVKSKDLRQLCPVIVADVLLVIDRKRVSTYQLENIVSRLCPAFGFGLSLDRVVVRTVPCMYRAVFTRMRLPLEQMGEQDFLFRLESVSLTFK